MVAAFFSDPQVLLLATLLRDFSLVVHAGGIFTFALLTALSARVGGPPTAHVLRTYRAYGPALGISLGLAILGALSVQYGTVGAFDWSPTPATGGTLRLCAWLAFFVAWVSNIRLEVWTLEPLRKLDPEGTGSAADPTALERATRSTQWHLLFQATLWAAVLILARLSSMP